MGTAESDFLIGWNLIRTNGQWARALFGGAFRSSQSGNAELTNPGPQLNGTAESEFLIGWVH